MEKKKKCENQREKQEEPWFKKGSIKVIIIVLIILAIIIPPSLQLVIYIIKGGFLFLSGELLVYYGAFLAFVGTIFLALVAWRQNMTADLTNQRLADANDELVAINRDLQKIQMAEKRAIFELIYPLEPSISQVKNNLLSVTFNFELITVNGRDFNCFLIFLQIYSSNNSCFIEYMNDKANISSEPATKPVDFLKVQIMQHPQKLVTFNHDVPAELLNDKQVLVLCAALEHEDIYGRTHRDMLKIFYEIKSNMILKFACYSIKPVILFDKNLSQEEKT